MNFTVEAVQCGFGGSGNSGEGRPPRKVYRRLVRLLEVVLRSVVASTGDGGSGMIHGQRRWSGLGRVSGLDLLSHGPGCGGGGGAMRALVAPMTTFSVTTVRINRPERYIIDL